MDQTSCESMGGRKFGCSACARYHNVKKEFCPVMCGLCDAPCEGKICKNGGKLNRDTCECSCAAPFVGETCEELSCPSKDSWECGKYLFQKHCRITWVRSKCPYMCESCPGAE